MTIWQYIKQAFATAGSKIKSTYITLKSGVKRAASWTWQRIKDLGNWIKLKWQSLSPQTQRTIIKLGVMGGNQLIKQKFNGEIPGIVNDIIVGALNEGLIATKATNS